MLIAYHPHPHSLTVTPRVSCAHQVWGRVDDILTRAEVQEKVKRAPWGTWPKDKFVPHPYWLGASVKP